MSPELRYAAQLNRIARVIELAHENGDGIVPDENRGRLLDASRIVRTIGTIVVQRVQKRGSGFSAPNSQVNES